MRSIIKLTAWIAAIAVMFSFSPKPGGDSYQVYLDNKLVLEQYVHNQKSVPVLSLDLGAEQSQVAIHYSHCGQIGTARNIIIKSDNKVVKEWHFPDAPAGTKSPMTLKVKDLSALKGNGKKLSLYYSSTEIKDGKLLASVAFIGDNKTASN